MGKSTITLASGNEMPLVGFGLWKVPTETCANIAFGGPKRNRLFMCAGQSLYALYVNTQGAAPG